MKRRKTSETKFILEIIITLMYLIPALLIKKAREKLRLSWEKIKRFVWEEKATATLILIISSISIIGWFLPETIIDNVVQRPMDLLSAKAYTIITAGFFHANIGHLFGNMLALFIFGRQVESVFKAKKFIISYFAALIISGVINSIIHIVIGGNTPGLGASGAIMGIVALAMLTTPLRITYILIMPLPIVAVGWLFIIADIIGILGPADGIGHFAHLGGFLSIIVIAYFFSKEEKKKMRKGMLICLATLLIMVMVRLILS